MISPTRTSPLYSAGLAVVAFAMVLLPLIYISLIGLTAWLVLLHLRYNTWLLTGRGGGLFRFIAYLGPVVAGGILVFFMIKPFFAKKPKRNEPITLNPAGEPLLFSFVERICQQVGAAKPCRIDVDCQVNASAGLRRGFWSRELVLTIGLPLVAGLDMRQFAGVLAHEFGHFAQGAGMRLTYIIRQINFWFARVVYERDEWDDKLEQSARNSDWRFGIVLHTARGCVWLTRRILWVLMQVGTAISCFMLRQMEYDADSYEAKIAGSDAFEATSAQLRLLGVATQSAYADVKQSWASKRLPENLPLLIQHKVGSLPTDVVQKISDSASQDKTGWFDTHPADPDRIKAARKLNQSGVFRVTAPAAELFSDFSQVSKTVTRGQYQHEFELEFSDQNLMSSQEILEESKRAAEAAAMVRAYYGEVNISLAPLLMGNDAEAGKSGENLVESLRGAVADSEARRPDAEKISAACEGLEKRLVQFAAAYRLTRANFKIPPAEFDLPESATTAGDQEIAARNLMQETEQALDAELLKLHPFLHALERRVRFALALAQEEQAEGTEADRVAAMLKLLAAVGAEMTHAFGLGSKARSFALLAQNRGNHADPAQVDKVLSDLSTEMRTIVSGIQERLSGFEYPFPHAAGKVSVAAYARFEGTEEEPLLRSYYDANAHADRLYALHYQLLGRVLAWAAASEKKALGMAQVART